MLLYCVKIKDEENSYPCVFKKAVQFDNYFTVILTPQFQSLSQTLRSNSQQLFHDLPLGGTERCFIHKACLISTVFLA